MITFRSVIGPNGDIALNIYKVTGLEEKGRKKNKRNKKIMSELCKLVNHRKRMEMGMM